MAAADLAITKPGGLTTSECLAMGLPMIVISPIPGQEERNADFLLEDGAALKAIDAAALEYKVAPAARAAAPPGRDARAMRAHGAAARGRGRARSLVAERRDDGAAPAAVAARVDLLGYVVLLALFFAQVEIQIEGAAGWAAQPADLADRAALAARPVLGRARPHRLPRLGVLVHGAGVSPAGGVRRQRWSSRIELRILGALALFWIIEDWLWFVMNPAFGLVRFAPHVPWHKHWLGPCRPTTGRSVPPASRC